MSKKKVIRKVLLLT